MQATEKKSKLFAECFGFACYQGFVFAVLLMSGDCVCQIGGIAFPRIQLVSVLLAFVVALVLLRALADKVRNVLLSRPMVVLAALCAIAAQLAVFALAVPLVLYVALGLVAGVCCAIHLYAWGKLMGNMALHTAMLVAIVGTFAGALICLLVPCIPSSTAQAFVFLLPLGSASALFAYGKKLPADQEGGKNTSVEAKAEALVLSARVLSGALVYGIAMGVSFSALDAPVASGAQTASPAFALLFFCLLCVAALQLFLMPARSDDACSRSGGAMSHAARSQKLEFATPRGSLRYLYRLALLMVVAGCLFTPALAETGVSGQTIALAGLLGIQLVLTLLFIASSFALSASVSRTLAAGFAALVGGQAVGLAAGNVLGAVVMFPASLSISLALVGFVVLCSFLFLLTEADLRALTEVAEESEATGGIDQAAQIMTQTFGLSKREAELLPLALRGRTAERIAEEFVISKSTVDTHLRRIYAKCGVHNRQELIDLGEETARDC